MKPSIPFFTLLFSLTLSTTFAAQSPEPAPAPPNGADAPATKATTTGATPAETSAPAATSPDAPAATPAPPGASTSPAMTDPSAAADGAIVAVTLPSSGAYLILTEDPGQPGRALTAPISVNGPKAAVALPASVRNRGTVVLSVIDSANQVLARKTADVKNGAASVAVAAADFNRVASLPVLVTSNGKGVSTALVQLVQPDGTVLAEEQLLPGMGGMATFKAVPAGTYTVRVTYNDGQTATQEITVDTATPPNQRRPEVTVANAAITEPIAPHQALAPSSQAVPQAANAPEGAAGNAPAQAQVERTDAPQQPAPAASPLQGFIGFLIALGILAMLGVAAAMYLRTNPEAMNRLLGKLPLPEDEPESLRPAEPPPVQVPEGSCAFCGGVKDPVTGACACTAPAGAAAAPTAVPASTGAGPRLVGIAGPLAGRTFPLESGAASIGREPVNDISLEGDQTASRRHARVEGADGTFTVRDEGSSNGTYVNGARVTEASLHPGDELAVGQTRFRFEA